MNLTWKRVLPVSLVIAALVAAMTSLAFAGDSTTGQAAHATPVPGCRGWGRKGGPCGGGFILGYIKGKTDIDLKTLLDEIKGGKTLEEIAAEYGLDLTALKDELAANSPEALWSGIDKETVVILNYIAKKADLDIQTLADEYKGGKSLEDIATERGLDLATIKDEMAANAPAGMKGEGKDAWAVLCYIAGKADVDVKTLMDEYQGGKSLADIATEHGLDLATIEAGITAARPGGKLGGFKQRGFGGFGPKGMRGPGVQKGIRQGTRQGSTAKGL